MILFLTFTTYGTHLPGDVRGSFDHIRDGERRYVPPNAGLEKHRRKLMPQPPYALATSEERTVVRTAIIEVCGFRGWFLHALHVRTKHVHGIVDSALSPSRIMNDWKAYATRALRTQGLVAGDRIIWTHGGGVQTIRSSDHLESVIRYVLDKQGEPMEIYLAGDR